MSIGAFKLEDCDRLGELAGVNILFVFTEEIGNALDNFTVRIFVDLLDFKQEKLLVISHLTFEISFFIRKI